MPPNGLQDYDLEGFGSGGRDRTYDQLINSLFLQAISAKRCKTIVAHNTLKINIS